ncbi:hypothetical protein ACVWYG_000459 [Pedobacter sp. UYEF25]
MIACIEFLEHCPPLIYRILFISEFFQTSRAAFGLLNGDSEIIFFWSAELHLQSIFKFWRTPHRRNIIGTEIKPNFIKP